ncbi:MAG: hypothetical protein R3266_06425 [Gemmatimonadota bacterium]|nr:hypothetical protein [Gemmatimonadota bacterium]
MKLPRTLTASAAALALVALGACDQSPSAPDGVTDASGAQSVAPAAADGVVEVGEFEVCKTYVGNPGPAVTVDWEVDRESTGFGNVDLSGSVSLADGDCAVVHSYIEDAASNSGAEIQRVTVTEQAVPGYSTEYVLTTRVGPSVVTDPPVAGNSASGDMQSAPDNGFLVEFINTEIFVPGNEGCTPGFWRQEHHFDSYPAGFAPTTPFIGATTGFTYDPALQGPESGNASDLDLLGALTLRGGGPNALIRHAAAAILNANSSGVAYSLSVGDVQNLYNVDMDKDALEAANEAGCPLN